MDSITQGLLGATIAQAAFRDKLGGRAVAWAAFCAVAPDFDFVAGLHGQWTSLVHHRGYSHSLIVLTVLCPLVGWLGQRFGKGVGGYRSWVFLSWWALITHPLLDWFTSYGTQLLAPLSNARFSLDGIAIIDPVYTLPLIVACVVAARKRWHRAVGQRVAIAALAFSTAYLGFGLFQSRSTLAEARADLRAQGFEPVRSRAFPTALNSLVHRVVARNADGQYRITVMSRTRLAKPEWRELSSPRDPLVDVALASERGLIYQWFSDDLFLTQVERTEGGATVTVSDLRYGSIVDPTVPMWGAHARFDAEGRLTRWDLWRQPRRLDMKAELRQLWWLITARR